MVPVHLAGDRLDDWTCSLGGKRQTFRARRWDGAWANFAPGKLVIESLLNVYVHPGAAKIASSNEFTDTCDPCSFFRRVQCISVWEMGCVCVE